MWARPLSETSEISIPPLVGTLFFCTYLYLFDRSDRFNAQDVILSTLFTRNNRTSVANFREFVRRCFLLFRISYRDAFRSEFAPFFAIRACISNMIFRVAITTILAKRMDRAFSYFRFTNVRICPVQIFDRHCERRNIPSNVQVAIYRILNFTSIQFFTAYMSCFYLSTFSLIRYRTYLSREYVFRPNDRHATVT